MHRILKQTGILCVHLDYKSVHYIKIELDEIFGFGNKDKGKNRLINEIIWHYRRYSANSKAFQNMHDTILCYSKTKNYFFKTLYQEYQETNIKNHPWQQDKEGRTFYLKRGKHTKPYKVYMNDKGVRMNDVFIVPQLSPISKERLGFPTQKPSSLLNRLLESFTDKNYIVADFFCGCGTTISSSEGLGRKWIGCDVSKESTKTIRKRMARDHKLVL